VTLTRAGAERLLDQALERVDPPPTYGAVLEGSIAEGFGNSSSDVDFLVVGSGDGDLPTMPSVLFIDGRRVEVRLRSEAQLARQVDLVLSRASAGSDALRSIPEDLLNRCQRFTNSVTIHDPGLVEELRARLPRAALERIVSAWFADAARQASRHALVLRLLHCDELAARWAQRAVKLAAKSWLAAHGETYLEEKWISEQWMRVDGHDGLRARFSDAEARAATHTPEYLGECLKLVLDFGVVGWEKAGERVRLARRPGVTTWQLGDRLHVVRDRRDVFVLGATAARAWRAVLFGVPLLRVLDAVPLAPEDAGAMIAEFWRTGLLSVTWGSDGAVVGMREHTPAPQSRRPIVSTHGLTPVGQGVELGPLPARRFAMAGAAQAWHNMSLENAREDLAGALDAGQSAVSAVAALRMLRNASLIALSAYGVDPRPASEEAPWEVARVPDMPPDIAEAAVDLERELTGTGLVNGAPVLARLKRFIRRVREVVESDFPDSFGSADGWCHTLSLGYDWVRLGAHLDADFPIDEVRDLIADGTRAATPEPSPALSAR
jgi:hypothetical protein